jgi:hypothetical protein
VPSWSSAFFQPNDRSVRLIPEFRAVHFAG